MLFYRDIIFDQGEGRKESSYVSTHHFIVCCVFVSALALTSVTIGMIVMSPVCALGMCVGMCCVFLGADDCVHDLSLVIPDGFLVPKTKGG